MTDDRERPRVDAGGFDRDGSVEADQLRDDFRALRDDTRASGRVPDFQAMMERAREAAGEGAEDVVPIGSARSSEKARRDLLRMGRWVPLAAAAAVVGLLFVRGGETGSEDDFERLVADYSSSAASWRSPTASLMDIPGVDLGSVPSFGAPVIDVDIPDSNSDEGRDI